MNLYITLDTTATYIMHTKELSFYPETMNIAGKEVVKYWLEWARHQGYKKLYINTMRIGMDNEKIQMLQDLYGIEVIYQTSLNQTDITIEKEEYDGMGIFLDSGEYRRFKSLDEVLMFEQELIYHPLSYCSLVGYGKSEHIHVGKNVYIHKSAKLSGAVIIGDNCIIEKDVEIKDSVINNDCLIKERSIVENSHIGQNIHMTTNLYLKDKALFESSIYDRTKKVSVIHEGICSTS